MSFEFFYHTKIFLKRVNFNGKRRSKDVTFNLTSHKMRFIFLDLSYNVIFHIESNLSLQV